MSALDDLLKEITTNYLNHIDTSLRKFNELNDNLYNFFKYAETDDISYLIKEQEKETGKASDKSSKENEEPNIPSLPEKKTRQKKALLSADSTYSTIPQIKIKQEKLSISSQGSMSSINSTTHSETSTRNNGTLKAEGMPAPSKLPPRKKKIKVEPVEKSTRPVRSTRTKPKRYLVEEKTPEGKSSDVVIQDTTITMIDITDDKDSDRGTTDDEQSKKDNPPTRSTRTKTRQQKKQEEQEIAAKNKNIEDPSKINDMVIKNKQNKRIRSTSNNEDDIKEKEPKRSKSSSSSEADHNKTSQTDYEDAVSNIDPNEHLEGKNREMQNDTMAINSTMVVENPKVIKSDKVQKEPEQDRKGWKTPPRTDLKKKQLKEIFSPFEKTSLKKKVEAFEKFGTASKEIASASKIPIMREDRTSGDPGSAIKPKPFTPFTSKFMPKTCSTSKKMSHNDSALSMKTLSSLKASQAEYREREKRRQEKEREAQLKKEALLQAQAEEKRKKREEKEQKAQQQREMLQKEKEKQLEMQKLKEEKHKKALAEKEEKIQKNREEAEKRRLLAKNKAKLAKEMEEQKAAQEMKEQMKRAQKTAPENSLPIYMVTKAPMLPTDDCYDSDDEEYRSKHYQKPHWCTQASLTKQLYAQMIAGEKIKNTLFCSMNQQPDLVQIFENIDPRKLKRTSSAVWKKPPRYTLFSMTSDIHFSEDSGEEVDV